LDPYEAMVWANMPIDRIETLIGIESELPNPREIAQKLQEEATEKEAYSPDAIPSILPQTLAQFWVKATFGFRHLLYCVLRSNKSKSKDEASNKSKDKPSRIETAHRPKDSQ